MMTKDYYLFFIPSRMGKSGVAATISVLPEGDDENKTPCYSVIVSRSGTLEPPIIKYFPMTTTNPGGMARWAELEIKKLKINKV